MNYDELAEYSEDNFESMVAGWGKQDFKTDLARNLRWWRRFICFVGGIVTVAFLMGYALARLS